MRTRSAIHHLLIASVGLLLLGAMLSAPIRAAGIPNWSGPFNLGSGTGDDRLVRLTSSADGQRLAASYRDGGTVMVSASANAGDSWSAGEVSNGERSAADPHIAGSRDGMTLIAVWTYEDNYEIAARWSKNGGQSWGAEQILSDPNCWQPEVALSPDGQTATVVWVLDTNPPVIQSTTTSDGGSLWAAVQNLSDGSTAVTDPEVAKGGTNTVVVWGQDPDGGKYEPAQTVRSIHSADAGQNWGAVNTLSQGGEDVDSVDVVSFEGGNKFATIWERQTGGFTTQQAQVSVSSNGGQSWPTPGAVTNLTPDPTAGGTDVDRPFLAASSNSSTLLAVWEWAEINDDPDVVQGRRSADGGASWAPAVQISDGDSQASRPAPTVSADGGVAAVIWHRGSEDFPVDDWPVQVKRSTDGGASWGAQTQLSSASYGNSNRLATSETGNVIFAGWIGDNLDGTEPAQGAVLRQDVTATPNPVNFGSHVVGSSTSLPASVDNAGTAALELGAATVTGPDASQFKIGTNGCSGTVAAGGSCSVQVAFSPTSSGTKSATLQIPTDDAQSPHLVSLTGTGWDLAVTARAKAKKLKVTRKTKIVKEASVEYASLSKVKVTCLLNGKKIRGKDRTRLCKPRIKQWTTTSSLSTQDMSVQATTNRARIKVTPSCSVGLKIKARIAATDTNGESASWKRTWRVKNAPRTICSLGGNG